MNYIKLIRILNESKLAIIPTDTTYGIICDATSDEAVRKIFLAKERDFHKPLIVLVSDKQMVINYTKKITPLEKMLIDTYWPGPLTILLRKNSLISDLVTSSSPYVGIRIPNNKNLRELIKKFNKPIVATSANISGEEVVSDAKNIDEKLLKKIHFIQYAGPINNKPSTLIKVEKEKISILREGILAEQIKKDFQDYLEIEKETN